MKKIVFLIGAMLALTFSHTYAINTGNPALDAQINSDPRQLHMKKWLHGPAVDTVENYEFNVAIWNVQVAALRVHTQVRVEDEAFLEELRQACNNLLKWDSRFPLIVEPIRAYVSEYMRAHVGVFYAVVGLSWEFHARRQCELKGHFVDANVTGVRGQNLAERDIMAWSIALSSKRELRADELGPDFFTVNPYFDDHGDQAAMYVTQRFYQDLGFLKKHNWFSDRNKYFGHSRVLDGTDAVFVDAVSVASHELVLSSDDFSFEGKFRGIRNFFGEYLVSSMTPDAFAELHVMRTQLLKLVEPASKKIQKYLLDMCACSLNESLSSLKNMIYDYLLAYYQDIPAWLYEHIACSYYLGDGEIYHEYIPYHIKARDCYEKAIKLYGRAVSIKSLTEAAEAYCKFDGLESIEYKIKSLNRALELYKLAINKRDPRHGFLIDAQGRYDFDRDEFGSSVSFICEQLEVLNKQLTRSRLKKFMHPLGVWPQQTTTQKK